MSESINTDSTEKLQELLETIASGINKTEEILAKSQQVEAEVSQHREAIEKWTLHTERRAYEVVEVQADIEQIANVVGSTVGELGGLDALESLQKEHKSILSTLEEIKAESQQFKKLQADAVHIDEKLTLIQGQFQTLSNLVSNAQTDLVGQVMSSSGGDLNQVIARATQEFRQEQQAIDNEHRQKIRTLERKQQSLISLVLGGVGVAVVLLIVILVIVVTKK